jgi:hypothetical protein
MSTRTVLLTLHIAAIASWLGVDVAQHAMRHRWRRETPEANKAWARTQYWLHDRYYAVVAAVILLSGIALVQYENWSWSSTFIWVGIVTIIAGATLGGIVLKGLKQTQINAFEASDDQGAAAAERRAVPIEYLLTVFVLVAVVSMVHKWGA